MDKKVDIIKDADGKSIVANLSGTMFLRQEYWYVMQKMGNCICMIF